MSEKLTIRDAAKKRMPLGGPDAQAMEGALQQAEREIADLTAKLEAAEEAGIHGETCPKCKGEGELYVGTSFPDDEGYTNCRYCVDGKLRTMDQWLELCEHADEQYYALISLKPRLEAAAARIKELLADHPEAGEE